MSDKAKLTKPRAKRRRFTKLEFPFPVPQQKNKDSNVWYYYEGFLRSNCVVVKNVGDLTFLYKMVCASTAVFFHLHFKVICSIEIHKNNASIFWSLLSLFSAYLLKKRHWQCQNIKSKLFILQYLLQYLVVSTGFLRNHGMCLSVNLNLIIHLLSLYFNIPS